MDIDSIIRTIDKPEAEIPQIPEREVAQWLKPQPYQAPTEETVVAMVESEDTRVPEQGQVLRMIQRGEPPSKEPAHVTTDATETSAARKARARRRYISTPTNLVLTPTDVQVTLDWTASQGLSITGYKILRDGVEIDEVAHPTVTYVDTGLSPSTQYTYTIYAYNQYQGTSGTLTAIVTTNAGP